MKGKVAFVLGVAVGYVLGTRAGRERYEQMKRGAVRVWETEPVQRGAQAVQGVIEERVEEFKVFVKRASTDAVSGLLRQTAPETASTTEPAPEAAPTSSTQASDTSEGKRS